MDENQTQAVIGETPEKKEERPVEKKEETAENKVQISFSVSFLGVLGVLLAFCSVALLSLAKVILYFGPSNPSVIRGIFAIFIYGTALAAVLVSYLKNRKPAFEFWVSVGALIAALWFY